MNAGARHRLVVVHGTIKQADPCPAAVDEYSAAAIPIRVVARYGRAEKEEVPTGRNVDSPAAELVTRAAPIRDREITNISFGSADRKDAEVRRTGCPPDNSKAGRAGCAQDLQVLVNRQAAVEIDRAKEETANAVSRVSRGDCVAQAAGPAVVQIRNGDRGGPGNIGSAQDGDRRHEKAERADFHRGPMNDSNASPLSDACRFQSFSLRERKHFDDGDACRIVRAAHDRGVARIVPRQRCNEGGLQIVCWGET